MNREKIRRRLSEILGTRRAIPNAEKIPGSGKCGGFCGKNCPSPCPFQDVADNAYFARSKNVHHRCF
jgi:hypothetical protein